MKLGIFLISMGVFAIAVNLINSIWWVRAIISGDSFWIAYYTTMYVAFGFLPIFFGIRRIRKVRRTKNESQTEQKD